MTTLTLEAKSFNVEPVPGDRLRITMQDPRSIPSAADDGGPEVTVQEAAAALGVSQRSIYNFINRQHNPLPARRVGGQYRIYERTLGQWNTKQPRAL